MKLRSGFFKTKSVLDFCRTVGAEDPVKAVQQSVAVLTKELGLEQPPFLPHKYAAIRGVKKVVTADMALDGRLVFSDGGFEIYVRSSHVEGRRNFTIAHETAHTFFLAPNAENGLDRSESGIGYFTENDDEEFLCDVAAAEMLMPEQCFRERQFVYGPSVRSVFRLAEEFKASLHAVARRIREVGPWKLLVTRWRLRDDLLEPIWSYPSRVLNFGPFEWLLQVRGPIRESLERGYAVGREKIRHPIGEEKYLVESKRMKDGALSVLIAERRGEYLLPMFDRANSSRQSQMWAGI